MTEPWEFSAVDALARMRAKELSPIELLASVRARAEQVEPTVNAFTETRFEESALAAKASAERYAIGEDIRALEGLPVSLKEEVPVEGWRMRYGSLAVDEVAHETAPIAELEALGCHAQP
jgi:aspartyl-tRNA(Asn)/glutamyl-tRNA(Gln) amidotransferase subunit A